jgi:hypothetical protein
MLVGFGWLKKKAGKYGIRSNKISRIVKNDAGRG